jgi:malic enzyme
MDEQIRQAALEYHRLPKPGKISIAPTKALTNQQDLSLAYSPGWLRPAMPSSRTRPRRRASPRAAT